MSTDSATERGPNSTIIAVFHARTCPFSREMMPVFVLLRALLLHRLPVVRVDVSRQLRYTSVLMQYNHRGKDVCACVCERRGARMSASQALILRPGPPLLVLIWTNTPDLRPAPTTDACGDMACVRACVRSLDIKRGSITSQYGVVGLPSVVMFRNGKPASRLTGPR